MITKENRSVLIFAYICRFVNSKCITVGFPYFPFPDLIAIERNYTCTASPSASFVVEIKLKSVSAGWSHSGSILLYIFLYLQNYKCRKVYRQ